jgi:hypothetical protein
MDSLNFFIIFHKNVYSKNIPVLPCFTYLSVNELIKKDVDINSLELPVINEYDLPGYNPMYQMLKFCDNSVILNLPSPPTPFIGFCQYDMIIDKNKFIKELDNLSDPKCILGFFPYNINTILDILDTSKWDQVLSAYNSLNNTSHSIEKLKEEPFFLMNTYILPSWFFSKLQGTVKILLPLILKFLNYNMRHIAGTLERLNSLIIACAIYEKKLVYYMGESITEDRSLTNYDELRH